MMVTAVMKDMADTVVLKDMADTADIKDGITVVIITTGTKTTTGLPTCLANTTL